LLVVPGERRRCRAESRRFGELRGSPELQNGGLIALGEVWLIISRSTRSWMLDAELWALGTRRWTLDAGCWPLARGWTLAAAR